MLQFSCQLFKISTVRVVLRSRALSSSCATFGKYKSKPKPSNNSHKLQELLFNMPKEELHLKEIRKMRMEKRSKRFSVQPSMIYWQVLGSGNYGAPTSLLLHTDHRKYLFNCGEGTQRLTSQLNLTKTLAQLEHVFITSKSWKNLGGLPGLCLTVRSCGAPDITIHGPRGCMELYEATKGFLTLFEFDVGSHHAEDGDFEDGAVRVETVVLDRDGQGLEIPALAQTWLEDDQAQWSKHYNNSVQAYICHFSPRPGRLDFNKCIELGLKPGPELGKLKRGEDVTLEDGTVVKSSDVVGEASPPSAYLILEIPHENFCHNLTKPKLTNIKNLNTVFHFTPSEVFKSARYQDYIRGLGADLTHVVMNDSCRGLGMSDVTSYSHKLRNIRSDFFPPLLGADDIKSAEEVSERMKSDLGENIVRSVTGLKIHVRPEQGLDTKPVVQFDEGKSDMEFYEAVSNPEEEEENKVSVIDQEDQEKYKRELADALEYAKTFQPSSMGDNDNIGDSEEYPVVTFLGTGSSIPSKYRNVSNILIETAADNFVILDCGEGSLSQMVRLFGEERTKHILRNLKCVYISHMHADHHLGLINIVQYRNREVRDGDKMYIVATDRIVKFWIDYHAKFEPFLHKTEFVKCERLILYNEWEPDTYEEIPGKKFQKLYPRERGEFLDKIGMSEFYTCRAIHCPNAFCVSFRSKEGFKISYSGDTRPCEKFRVISTWGGSPDLLIHEATMEHFMMYDAIIKKHTTFTEAIEEGRQMNSKFTLLTHFSQRYAKMPAFGEIENQPNVGVAFDNMVVRRNNMRSIPSLYPALSRWLSDYVDDLKERAEQYKQKHDPSSSGHGLDIDLEIDTPYMSKKKLAENLQKRHQDKHQWFLNVKKRKLLEKKEADEAAMKKREDETSSS